MKTLLLLIAALALSGCAFTQITIKAPKGQPGPTVGTITVETSPIVGLKGTAGSTGSSTEAGGAALDVSGTGL